MWVFILTTDHYPLTILAPSSWNTTVKQLRNDTEKSSVCT